jgi:hypothetical protein
MFSLIVSAWAIVFISALIALVDISGSNSFIKKVLGDTELKVFAFSIYVILVILASPVVYVFGVDLINGGEKAIGFMCFIASAIVCGVTLGYATSKKQVN